MTDDVPPRLWDLLGELVDVIEEAGLGGRRLEIFDVDEVQGPPWQRERAARERVRALERERARRDGLVGLGKFVENVRTGAIHRSDCVSIGNPRNYDAAPWASADDVGCWRCIAQLAREERD